MTPGIHYGVTFADYRSVPGMNASTLKAGRTSMLHLQHAIDNPGDDEDTKDKAFGRALHVKLLEPLLFEDQFVVSGTCAASTKAGKPCGNSGLGMLDGGWRCGVHGGNKPEAVVTREVLSEADAAAIDGAAKALRQHKAVKLLRAPGGCETTIVGELMGELCKGRLDKLVMPTPRTPGTIIDIKKVSKGRGTPDAFGRAIKDYGYHISAAWYVDLLAQHIDDDAREIRFFWVVVEDTAPHAVGVYRPEPGTIECGRREYRDLFAQMKACRVAGEWPGYTRDIEYVGLPDWYVKRSERFATEAA